MTCWLVLVESNTTGSGRQFCHSARRLGLRPVVLARDPARYPYLATDGIAARIVDTTEPAAVLATCAELGGTVAGVTSSSEYAIVTAAEAARSLGLPHPDPAAVRACRDKACQRDQLTVAGVPGARYATAATSEAAVAAAARIGYPVVVKPVGGSGSIATRRCVDADSVAAAARTVLDADASGNPVASHGPILVEEYLSGPEFSVETFDGRVVGVTGKRLGSEPYFVEVGHDFPAPVPASTRAALGSTALAALQALGLGWGPAHVELRLTATGPRIIEVNPRLAGGMIPRVVEAASGIDLIAQTVARAAGQPVTLISTRDQCAAIRFLLAGTGGRLAGVRGLSAARRVPGVVEVGLTYSPGQELVIRHSFQDRLGYVIAAGPDHDSAASAANAGQLALEPQLRHR